MLAKKIIYVYVLSILVWLTDILNDIISKRILDQGKRVTRDLGDQTSALLTWRVVDTALQNTTTMTVSANNNTVSANGIVNELCSVSFNYSTPYPQEDNGLGH